MQQSKIDSVVNDLIEKIQNRGRGFVLDLSPLDADQRQALAMKIAQIKAGADQQALEQDADLGELLDLASSVALDSGTAIEIKESLAPVDEYEKPVDWRNHELHDTESFIAYCLRYGAPAQSLVVLNEQEAQICLDEQKYRGERELGTYQYRDSDDWAAWSQLIGTAATHRQLLHFLLSREHNLEDATLLQTLRTVKLNSTMDFDSDVHETGDAISLIVKTNGGEETRKFRRRIQTSIPVLEQDVFDAASWASIELKLDVEMPSEPNKRPLFQVTCSTWRMHRLQRIRQERDAIRAGLGDGWTVVLGTHRQSERKIGRDRNNGMPF